MPEKVYLVGVDLPVLVTLILCVAASPEPFWTYIVAFPSPGAVNETLPPLIFKDFIHSFFSWVLSGFSHAFVLPTTEPLNVNSPIFSLVTVPLSYFSGIYE